MGVAKEVIPYGRPYLLPEDIENVVKVLQGSWLTCGPHVEIFEEQMCRVTESPFCVSASSNTACLHLALMALGVQEGDCVFVPSITFLASANAVRYVGAEVIFTDVDPRTGLMTAQTLEDAIARCSGKGRPVGVINVHLVGQCEDLEAIEKVARRHGLWVIEDAAHAIGSCYVDSKGKTHPVGANAFSDMTAFSFHSVKTVVTGEGGALTTSCAQKAQRLKQLRCHGMIRDESQWIGKDDYDQKITAHSSPWYYEMQELGFNYRLSDIACALGTSQLKRLSSIYEQRKTLREGYDAAFSDDPWIKPAPMLASSRTLWHFYPIHVDFTALGKTRACVMRELLAVGVGSQVHYYPVHWQPYYVKRYGKTNLEGARAYYHSTLTLPLFAGVSDQQHQFIIQAARNVIRPPECSAAAR